MSEKMASIFSKVKMLEVETIQTIHSSLTIATVIDVSFLL